MKSCLQHSTYSSASLSAVALAYPAFQGKKMGLRLIKQSFNRICGLFILGTCIEKVQACSCRVRDAGCLASVIFFSQFSTSYLHIANLAREFYNFFFFLLSVYTI